MPCSMTHTYYSVDVYDKLDKEAQNIIKHNIEDFKTFSQGPDIFFFYNFILGKKAVEISSFGHHMHRNKTKVFFINLIHYINDNNLKDDGQVMSFLYGFICHYILDSNVHPFVFYKTGIFNRKDKKTYKYNGLHNEMEYFIDIFMIYQKEKIEAKNFKAHNYLVNTKHFNKNLTDVINNVIEKTYNKKDMSKYYEKSIKHMKLFFRHFHYDHYGIKKQIYKIIDFVSPKKYLRKEMLSFNVPHNMKKHYLNLDKEEWNHPIDINEKYNYSFIELYVISINKAARIINKITKMLNNNKVLDKELDYLFENISYVTGKDCTDKRPMKYFEF